MFKNWKSIGIISKICQILYILFDRLDNCQYRNQTISSFPIKLHLVRNAKENEKAVEILPRNNYILTACTYITN